MHTDAVAVQNQLLAQQPGHPGLARLGITGDEHVAAARRQPEFAAVLVYPEQQPAPWPLRQPARVRICASVAHIRGDVPVPSAAVVTIGRGTQRRAAPRHGGADLGAAASSS